MRPALELSSRLNRQSALVANASLTPELLAELGKELGGYDFTDPNQIRFLSSTTSCDVQAAPGNGKTTLLAAKLSLLSRGWKSRMQGVCVISHTNAAREEIEKLLSAHPSAGSFLSYPHFVGTVTKFIDHFIALPYLRGLGWSVRRIDDEVFAAVACAKLASKPGLRAMARNAEYKVKGWVSQMELASNFEYDPLQSPQAIRIRHRHRQSLPASPTGKELQELKSEMVNSGLYRFADMIVLANKALDAYPNLVNRIRLRFPLVILDEAQDTNGEQLKILKRVFGQDVAYQCLGDQNQTLYENPDIAADEYWQPETTAIPLNETRRFGQGIANFASRLTVRKAQVISGKPNVADRRVLFLFDGAGIAKVLPAYVQEIQNRVGIDQAKLMETWAVASRHNSYRDQRGGWPKSLVDYHPPYRSGRGARTKPNTLCAAMREASVTFNAGKLTQTVMELLTTALIETLGNLGYQCPLEGRLSSRNIWRSLSATDPQLPLKVRRLFRDHVLMGPAAWERAAWDSFCSALRALVPCGEAVGEAVAYLSFDVEGATESSGQEKESQQVVLEGQVVRLGSIHSVKGRTVDAMLVVETEVYRGPAASERTMDLSTVLPHAFGIENKDLSARPVDLAAATYVFVGITRPRHFLALAMRRAAASAELIAAATTQGWTVRDLTIT
jgi:DNA helicase-2/ATP-dependent DNA helicase PcrA